MSSNSDWQQLLNKTKKRPLINMNAIIDHEGGLILKRKLVDRLLIIAISGALEGGCIAASFSRGVASPLIAQIIGGVILLLAVHGVLFNQKIKLSADGDLIVTYGFVLFPTRIPIERDSVVLEYRTGAETTLHSSLRGFKIVLIRLVETNEVAHLGYTLTSDEGVRTFDAMAKFMNAGENSSKAVVEMDNGFVLYVDTTVTWAAGKIRNYKSKLTVIDRQTVEIKRQTRMDDRSVVDKQGDIYPVRIEASPSLVNLIYSNHDEDGIDADDCVAIQICKEDISQRRTRYEINLIEGVNEATRHNLMSFDIWPQKDVANVIEAAENIAAVLELSVENHL